MSNDAEQIVIGANGRVLSAPVDSVVSWPDDIASALDPAFVEAGFTSEDGVTFTDGKTIADVMAWQAFYSVRKIVTEKASKVEFVMRQWNSENVKVAFGGGDIDHSSGVAVYTPPAPGELDTRAMIVEWTDNGDTYRLVLPRGLVTGEVSAQIMRTNAADLPVSFEVTPRGTPVAGDLSTEPWYLITDALAFAGS